VTVLATRGFIDNSSETRTKLVLAFGPQGARTRIEHALSAWPDVTTQSDPSLQNLLSWGTGVRLLIAYCESVSPEQLERFKEFKRDAPDLLIVAVCERADRRTMRRLLDGGIDGFVFAENLEEALGPTVAAVFAGQMVVPRDMRDVVDRPSLSTRERQILSMVVIGLTNQEIADMTTWFKARTLEDHGHFRTVEPTIVLEVAFNNVMRSTRHASGFALRFPRILRIRQDKPVSEIDTLARVEEIYNTQPDKPIDNESSS